MRYADNFSVLVNMARGGSTRKTFTSNRVARRFLQVNLRWAGYVPGASPRAVRRQQR
jgi:hypothetical protein